MKIFKTLFYLSFLIILIKSCRIINNPNKTSHNKKNDKLINKTSEETKKIYSSGKFVDIKKRRSEIFFIDDIKPKGHLVLIDSISQDSLVKMIIVNDTIIKN